MATLANEFLLTLAQAEELGAKLYPSEAAAIASDHKVSAYREAAGLSPIVHLGCHRLIDCDKYFTTCRLSDGDDEARK